MAAKFGVDLGVDPSQVREELNRVLRLRARLKEFYEDCGTSTGLRLELPKGGFMPVFVIEGRKMEMRNQGIWLWTGILVALLGVLIIGGVAWKSLS